MAAFLIGALSWYGLAWIPSQQRYFNERNVRLLRTIGTQILAKVNNFDFAIDHAIDSFSFEQKDAESETSDFRQYVKLFADQLDILAYHEDPKNTESLVHFNSLDAFADPPRITVEPDEGVNYVYIGYQRTADHHHRFVEARANMDRVVGELLESRREFDAVALVAHDGRVIAQRSRSGVELAHVELLIEPVAAVASGAKTPATPSSSEARTDSMRAVESIEATGRVRDVSVAGVGYKLWAQPVPLGLLDGESTGRRQAEWVLCGLVRGDSFRSASSAISATYWLILFVALSVLCLSIPLLKLRFLSPRERLKATDGLLVALTTFVAAGLATLALLDAYYFGYAFSRDTDGQLSAVAEQILRNFSEETMAVVSQLDASVRELDRMPPDVSKPPKIRITEREPACFPKSAACAQLVLKNDARQLYVQYPFFNLITWTDKDGQQLVKYLVGQRPHALHQYSGHGPRVLRRARTRAPVRRREPAGRDGPAIAQHRSPPHRLLAGPPERQRPQLDGRGACDVPARPGPSGAAGGHAVCGGRYVGEGPVPQRRGPRAQRKFPP